MNTSVVLSLVGAGLASCMWCGSAAAQALAPAFADKYSILDLGKVPEVVTNYGCLIFKRDDPNTLLIGGYANSGILGALWRTTVVRDANDHIVGFLPATHYCEAYGNDGGIAYAPNGTLLIPEYPANVMNQVKLGSTVINRSISLATLGIDASPGGTGIVPPGLPGAGRLKVMSYGTARWYDVPYSLAADGTYDLGNATQKATLGFGPEGFVYVPRCSPNFFAPSILVCEYSVGQIAAYTVDENGDPNPSSRRSVVLSLGGAEGAVIDPVTGDFIFGTYGGGNHLIRVSGFAAPPKCPVDFNEDCFLDFTDFDLFVEAFEGGDPSADFNGDGFITFEDFDDFVTALEKGGC